MALNALGLLLSMAASCLVVLGSYAIVISNRAGGDVMWIAGLNGWQAVIVGLGCCAAAASLFALEGIRNRLTRIEAKLTATIEPQ